MTNLPIDDLRCAANYLFEAIGRGQQDNHRLEVDSEGRLDLIDMFTGERQPVSWILVKKEG